MVFPDISGMIDAAKERKIQTYPCHTNRASQLGDDCLRKLVYYRTSWDKQQKHDVGLQYIFDAGNTIEKHAEQDLRNAGIQVFEQQRHIHVDERGENITGHMDNRISVDAYGNFVCEIKGLASWTWDRLNTPEDFFNSDKFYVRKYPAQLLIYLYGSGEPVGCFDLINKQTFRHKIIWFEFKNFVGYIQGLLDKAIAINAHVSDGTLPDYCNDPDNCQSCPFSHICNPPIESFGSVINDSELEELLNAKELLQPQAKAYAAVSDKIKEAVKGRDKIICGDWYITGKADKNGNWRSSIKRLTDKPSDAELD